MREVLTAVRPRPYSARISRMLIRLPGLKPAGGRGLWFAGRWDGQPVPAALSGRRQVPVAGAAVHRPPPAATIRCLDDRAVRGIPAGLVQLVAWAAPGG